MGAFLRWSLHPGLIVMIFAALWALADAQRPAEKCTINGRVTGDPYARDPYVLAPFEPDAESYSDTSADEPDDNEAGAPPAGNDIPVDVFVGIDFGATADDAVGF